MNQKTKDFYKAKADVFLEPYNATIPAGTLVVVFKVRRKKWEFVPLPFLEYMPMTLPEDEFYRLFERS